MRRIAVTPVALVLLALTLAGCERVKSATPLSPSIAGPIAGVEISQPTPAAPSEGARIASDTQPITFAVNNASSNGVRPLSYLFEVSTDYGFSTKVFTQSEVAPGDGRTTFRLPQNLAPDRVYYWRVKAYDGANEGEYSAPINFTVFTPVVIGTPSLVSPADGAVLTTRSPALTVQNASVAGPAGAISYIFEVATDSAMANRILAAEVGAGSGQTSYTTPELAASTRFFWRSRAFDFARVGDWSATRSFTTPSASVTPPGDPGGGGSGPAPNDQIDLRTVTFALGANISGWTVSSTVLTAAHTGDQLCINHTKAGKWPVLPFFDTGATIEGNQWFFASIGGKWIGGANEWLRPGQTCKVIDGHVGQGGFGGTALGNWTPAPGEVIGVAVSTPARTGQIGTAERSNVVLIKW